MPLRAEFMDTDALGAVPYHSAKSTELGTMGAPTREIGCHTRPRRRSAPETAEGYPAVVAVLDAKMRVIECAAGIQWIVQRRRGDQWHGESFCRTREALLRITGSHHPAWGGRWSGRPRNCRTRQWSPATATEAIEAAR